MLAIMAAPLIIAGISAVLAALISTVDKVVNNYGVVKIDINAGSDIKEVNGGEPLLSTLAGEKIFIPSACGGKGTCGACKVKVTSDIGPHLPTELPLLEKSEVAQNVRMACQVKVKQDIKIDIPEELFNIKQYKTVVESILDVTYDIKEVYLKLIEPDTVTFKAGQYGQIIIPPYGKVKGFTQRAYSMNSTPGDKNRLGFLIRLVPGGIATTYVHENLKVGQEFEVIAPVGDFMLQDTKADMLCVAGGSGMAPLHSILFDMLDRGDLDRKVYYFFGARTTKDLFYLDRFYELEKKWPNFHFIPALSEPQADEKWEGETGLITEVLDSWLKTKISQDTVKEGYLCGSPGMINACINVMTANDVKDENIYYDKFA